MTNSFSTACGQVEQESATVLENLGQTEWAVGELQGHIATLPFFARGFITSQVASGTGQDIPVWSRTIEGLTAALRGARAAAERARAAGRVDDEGRTALNEAVERVVAETPRLERLAVFMEKAPAKISAVPAAVLPADQRAEFLTTIGDQTRALRAALAAIPGLTTALRALGSSNQ